jgi:dienelactone hydrolase
VLSPGFTNSRSALTALARSSASHGYVVAGIDHTYESHATAFPDGRVTTCLARQAPRRDRKEEVAASRAADVCFVLDELTGAHPGWPGAGRIDLSRIAMAGHSAGGAAAIATMLADSRIRAGIDMDGCTAAPIPDEGLARPFLFLGKQSSHTPGSRGAVTALRDWKRSLDITRAMSGPSSTSTCADFTSLSGARDEVEADLPQPFRGGRAAGGRAGGLPLAADKVGAGHAFDLG